MEDLIYQLSPKAWFETSVNPFTTHVNKIQHSGTLSAGDRCVESILREIKLH